MSGLGDSHPAPVHWCPRLCRCGAFRSIAASSVPLGAMRGRNILKSLANRPGRRTPYRRNRICSWSSTSSSGIAALFPNFVRGAPYGGRRPFQNIGLPHSGGGRIRKPVRPLYGKCCGQRGGRGRLRICCCWSSNRRGSETPQPRRQTASPGFTVGALFCRRLFGLFAQDYTGRWIHVVDLAARETGHRHINVVVLRDVLGNKALNALSG